MAKQDRWPAEVRPFQWKELEELEPEGPAQRGSPPPAGSPGSAPAPASAPPDFTALLDEARREAAELVDGARAEADAIREAARLEGRREGQAEGRAALEETVARWAASAEELAGHKPRLLEEARAQVVDLTLALVEKLLGPLVEGDADVVTRVAGHALAALSDREMLTIRVNPDDLQTLVEAKPRLLQFLDGIKKLTVLEDHSVARGGCLVETATAEIDARLDAQLQELARTLKKPQ